MKRGLLVISILVALTLLVACSPQEKIVPMMEEKPAVQEETASPETLDNPVPAVEEAVEKEIAEDATITITSSGFEPKTLTIKAGTTVTFVNDDSNKHWPASAMHPTHAVYPESGGCIGSKFDACKGLEQGESFSFTFNEKGSWNYHDHLRSSNWGTIVVE